MPDRSTCISLVLRAFAIRSVGVSTMKWLPIMLLGLPSLAWPAIPATPLMTLYAFDGPREIPYYRADAIGQGGPGAPAGTLTQGTSVIPCLVVRDGGPLTDGRGTPYVGYEVVIDAETAGAGAADRFRAVAAARRGKTVANHHCGSGVRHVLDVRKLYALDKPPFFTPTLASPGKSMQSEPYGELDRIIRAFHRSDHCERANRALVGRREALADAWDRFLAEQRGDGGSGQKLARAKHLDYALRTALLEGHLDRGCSAYGACERNTILLSIRNRARGSCLAYQGCQFPGDFQGVASRVSQYNIWDEFLTQISGLTSCFLREELASGNERADYFAKLQAMYEQSLPDALRILFGSEGELRAVFPGVAAADLTSLRHYYHPPAMGKCFPKLDRIEYMSGAVARNGRDHALIANTRIQVGRKVGGGYLFRELEVDAQGGKDQVSLRDRYAGFVVDGRKVGLRGTSRCHAYGTPPGCDFTRVERYRRTPSWLSAGKPLVLTCRVGDRGEACGDAPRVRRAQVGGACDVEMQPVAGVR